MAAEEQELESTANSAVHCTLTGCWAPLAIVNFGSYDIEEKKVLSKNRFLALALWIDDSSSEGAIVTAEAELSDSTATMQTPWSADNVTGAVMQFDAN